MSPTPISSLDNEIECAHCGAHFYYELLNCPQCGRSVYGEEEEPDLYTAGPEPPGLRRLGDAAGLLLGWFAAGLVLAAVFLPLRSALRISPHTVGEHALLWITAAAAAFAAGFLAGRFTSRRGRLLGLLAGAGSAVLAILLVLVLYGSALPLLADPLSWLGAPLAALSGWGGSALVRRLEREDAAEALFGPVIQENMLCQRLLAICRHDKDTAERLIEYERRRAPGAARHEWIQRAVERWERENR
jgi:hypothetical protein